MPSFSLFFYECLIEIKRWRENLLIAFYLVLGIFFYPFLAPDLSPSLKPVCLWIHIILTLQFALKELFKEQFASSQLDDFFCAAYSLEWLLFFKLVAQSFRFMIILWCILPFISLLLQLDLKETSLVLLTSLGTIPLVVFMTSITAALSINSSHPFIMPVVMLPLQLPILIFSVGIFLEPSFFAWMLILGLNLMMIPVCIFFVRTILRYL